MKNFIPELLKRKIVIISDYVNPKKYSKQELDDESNFIDTIKREINEYGVQIEYIELKNLDDLKESLKKFNKNEVIIFNWCEFLEEKEGTAHLVTEFLESSRFIFTGADTQCLLLTGSKEKTKRKLLERNILTPKYVIIKKSTDIANIYLNYPLMLKLENRHASVGITNENVVYDVQQLTKVSQKLLNKFHTNLIAEEFIDGQEFTVTVWGNELDTDILTCVKLDYIDKNISNMYTEDSKEHSKSRDYKNTLIKIIDKEKDKETIDKTRKIVLDSYRVLNFLDYGRFELRERKGKLHVIDCNPNQYIGPDSFLYHGSKMFGYNYGETLLQICEFAVKRNM